MNVSTLIQPNVPDWAREAIWYQIFPERFRNGCPASNPQKEDLDKPPEEAWSVHPWGHDWYRQEPWESDMGSFYKAVYSRRFGGDLVGVMEKLDYLQNLGITAIYLNPVFQAQSLHKYDATCFHHIDPSFGPDREGDLKRLAEAQETDDPATWIWTAADRYFLDLVEEIHRRGMRVIIDGVFNHTGKACFAFDDLVKNGKESRYRDWYTVKKWNRNGTFEYEGWFGHTSLPELARTEEDLHPEVKAYFFNITQRWMAPDIAEGRACGVDGWRLDVAFCVPDGFWKDWRVHVKTLNPDAYITGEIVEMAEKWVQGDQFDAVMNYMWLFPVVIFFSGMGDVMDAADFKKRMNHLIETYPDEANAVMQNLLDGHDVGRVYSMIENGPNPDLLDFEHYFHASRVKSSVSFNTVRPSEQSRQTLMLMTVFQMTWLGAPMIYYGTEVGMWGANDPDNRQPMLWDDLKFEPEQCGINGAHPSPASRTLDRELFSFFQKVIQVRRESAPLNHGSVEWVDVGQDTAQAKSTDDSTSKNKEGVVICPPEKPAVRATIILDADWSLLKPEQKFSLVSKMSRFSRIPLTAFRLLPEKDDVKGYQALAAGSGNIESAKHEGLSLSWVVGCGRNVDQLPVVTILEGASKDGTMAEKLNYDIKGWHVSSNTPIVRNRVRRQAPLMGTVVPTLLPTGAPRPTELTATITPSTHIVPTEASPVLTSMIRTAGTQDTMTMTVTDTRMATGKVSVSPSVKATKTSFYQTPVITPTPTPTDVSATATPTEAPTRTFSPPVPSMTSTEGLSTLPGMTSSPYATGSVMMTKTTFIAPTKTEPATPPSAPTTPSVITEQPNQPPTLNRPIERIDVTNGIPLVFVIPADTFIDPEDGDTRNLRLTLLTADGSDLLPKWLTFDKKKQTIFAYTDKFIDVASYILVGQDKEGIAIQDVFEVHVLDANTIQENPPPVAMGATLNIDFDEFINNPELQLDVLNRIASVFGDPDASALTITGLQRGSVILSFTNNTIPKDSCPIDLIEELMKKLVTADGKPTQALIDAFAPNYTISGVEAAPQGTCVETTPVPTVKTFPPFQPPNDRDTGSNDAWITNVLPGVIVAFIIILAGIVVFILYRKNRKGKLSDEDQNTFINKGIPIIFAEELDEADKQPSSTPLIMKNEKPPLPPPEYTAEDGTRQPLLNDNNKPNEEPGKSSSVPMVDLGGSPPYEPPPPLTPSPPENRNPHAASTTRYQSPPAYVPP